MNVTLYTWRKTLLIYIILVILGFGFLIGFDHIIGNTSKINYYLSHSGIIAISLFILDYGKNIFIFSLFIAFFLTYDVFLFSRINTTHNDHRFERINHNETYYIFTNFIFGMALLAGLFFLLEILLPAQLHSKLEKNMAKPVKSSQKQLSTAKEKEEFMKVLTLLSNSKIDDALAISKSEANNNIYPYKFICSIMDKSKNGEKKQLVTSLQNKSPKDTLLGLYYFGLDEKNKYVTEYEAYLFLKSIILAFPEVDKEFNRLRKIISDTFPQIEILSSPDILKNFTYYNNMYLTLKNANLKGHTNLKNVMIIFNHTYYSPSNTFFEDAFLTAKDNNDNNIFYSIKYCELLEDQLLLYNIEDIYSSSKEYISHASLMLPLKITFKDILYISKASRQSNLETNYLEMVLFYSKAQYLKPVLFDYHLLQRTLYYLGYVLLLFFVSYLSVKKRILNVKVPNVGFQLLSSLFIIIFVSLGIFLYNYFLNFISSVFYKIV